VAGDGDPVLVNWESRAQVSDLMYKVFHKSIAHCVTTIPVDARRVSGYSMLGSNIANMES